ncbi:MAG: amidohydrolase family protein [Streptosporangiaceae bacterium]
MLRIVALEEHFVVPELLAAWERVSPPGQAAHQGLGDSPLGRRLLDVGAGRLAAMDDQGVDVQVLSLTTPGVQNLPPAESVAVARDANDALAEIVRATPERFQGFAAVPTPDPQAAAAELERAVTRLGFRGAMLNGRTGTVNADAAEYDDLYGTAERLRAPLYLHPQTPVAPVCDAYYSGLGDPVDAAFAGHGLGWHYETGVQLLRLIFSGVFDRHPGLQVIVGHWGEVVMFFLERIARMQETGLHLDRPLPEYFRQNAWVTGSGILSERYLRWSIEVIGAERILYSTDYPYIDTGAGKARSFLENAPLADDQKAAVASGAWEQLTGHIAAGG